MTRRRSGALPRTRRRCTDGERFCACGCGPECPASAGLCKRLQASRTRRIGASGAARLVRRRMLHAIDHPYLHWSLRRIELQSELLLKRGEEVRRVGIDGGRRRTWRELARWHLGLELELELPVAGESCAIDNGAADAGRDAPREQLQRVIAKPDAAGALLDAADHRRRSALRWRRSTAPRGQFLG